MCKLLSLISEEFYSAIVRYFARFLNIRIALVGFFDVYRIGQTWLINNKRIAICYELSKRRTISVRLVNWRSDERVWRFVELIDAAIHVSLLMQSMYELVTHTCHSFACARTHTRVHDNAITLKFQLNGDHADLLQTFVRFIFYVENIETSRYTSSRVVSAKSLLI